MLKTNQPLSAPSGGESRKAGEDGVEPMELVDQAIGPRDKQLQEAAVSIPTTVPRAVTTQADNGQPRDPSDPAPGHHDSHQGSTGIARPAPQQSSNGNSAAPGDNTARASGEGGGQQDPDRTPPPRAAPGPAATARPTGCTTPDCDCHRVYNLGKGRGLLGCPVDSCGITVAATNANAFHTHLGQHSIGFHQCCLGQLMMSQCSRCARLYSRSHDASHNPATCTLAPARHAQSVPRRGTTPSMSADHSIGHWRRSPPVESKLDSRSTAAGNTGPCPAPPAGLTTASARMQSQASQQHRRDQSTGEQRQQQQQQQEQQHLANFPIKL